MNLEIKILRRYNPLKDANRYSILKDGEVILSNISKREAEAYMVENLPSMPMPNKRSDLTITPFIYGNKLVGYWYNLVGERIDLINIIGDRKFAFDSTKEDYSRIHNAVKQLHMYISNRNLSINQIRKTIISNGEIINL
jgi:ribonucleotide monophosphatase NagD (HAD superfamily)